MKGDERGSATLWSVSALVLISATVAWALLWAAAEGTRHSAERTADSAALAAATAALRRLALRDDSDPCLAAARVATAADAELTACECVPVDCTVAVRRNLPLLGTARATSRAGPVGESGGEDDGEGEGEPQSLDQSARSASGHSVGSVSDHSGRSASGQSVGSASRSSQSGRSASVSRPDRYLIRWPELLPVTPSDRRLISRLGPCGRSGRSWHAD